ncbi:MAG TPA: WYL domain-containing protein [Streptosporangiaceae bacterium]
MQRARVRLSPRGRRLAALLGRPAGLRIRRSARPDGAGAASRDGRGDWVEAWLRIDSADATVLDLLALGAEVEVVQPAELRARVAETARRIADLNTAQPDDEHAAADHAPGGTT